MLAKIKRYLPGIAAFLIGGGLQVSGVQLPWLGYSLMSFGVVLLAIPIWPAIRKRLSAEHLSISGAESYEVGDGSQWLRLRVENTTSSPVHNCYGKLVDRRQVNFPMGREAQQVSISPEAGRRSREHGMLPPEGHRFPWSPTDHSLTAVSISGNHGSEFLYLATNDKITGCFWFPVRAGNKYENWGLGDFELKIEIGSESEEIASTKVCVVFRATGGDLKLTRWERIK